MSSKRSFWFKSKVHRLLWLSRTYPFRRKSVSFGIDPARIFWVDPARIKLSIDSQGIDRLAGEVPPPCPIMERGRIIGGNWDLQVKNFEDMDVWQAFRHRFIEGGQWVETPFYARVIKTISSGIPLWRCKSKEEFDSRLKYIDRLFSDIQKNGYRAQTEMEDTARSFDNEDEINVHIGRFGDYIFANGRHRLCIAKILQLPKIPVKVARRHSQWASFRTEVLAYIRKGARLYAPILHPDMSDIPAVHGHERMEIIRNHLPEKPGKMLDIGAHWGYFCHRFEDLGYHCTAVETSPLNVRFMERLRRAENKEFQIIQDSVLDHEFAQQFDVVLALNIFHHFLKEHALYEKLVRFLRGLDAKVMFFEPHKPSEPQMKGAFRNYSPEEFAEFVKSEGEFHTYTRIGTLPDERFLFKLAK